MSWQDLAQVVAVLAASGAAIAAFVTVMEAQTMRREAHRDRLLDSIVRHGEVLMIGGPGVEINEANLTATGIRLLAAIAAFDDPLPACQRLTNEGEFNLTSGSKAVMSAVKDALEEARFASNAQQTNAPPAPVTDELDSSQP